MNDRGFPFDSGWDDGVYGTGSTQPPKSHRALLALLLVIIIFLGGIATALSILNIRLFHELHQREDALTVAYAVQSQTEAEAISAAWSESAVTISARPSASMASYSEGRSLRTTCSSTPR